MSRHSYVFALLMGFMAGTAAHATAEMMQVIRIDSGWTFRLAPDADQNHAPGLEPRVTTAELTGVRAWLPAEVPGVVQTDLLRNKVIPDPFFRDNEMRLQWIGLEDWESQTTFELAPALLRRKHVELVCKGLDTYATVFINEQGVLRADNMFREWRVDAKPYLKLGRNTRRVVFPRSGALVLRRLWPAGDVSVRGDIAH